jgi:glucosamine--fructose-6-phosphate aminotransferase (isomerizing)
MPDNPLAKAAQHLIQLQAGPEKAVAATKTYTTSLGVLALLSACLQDDKTGLEQINQVPEWMESCIHLVEPVMRRVERYRYMSHCVVIGRGYNYATAFEIALKVKELTRTITEPYSSADFRHGPIALVREGFPVIVAAPGGVVSSDLFELVRDLKQRGAELLIISDQQDLLASADLPLPLPEGMPEWLTPLAAVIPGQLFALALAQARGLNPDHPEGLNKITETT